MPHPKSWIAAARLRTLPLSVSGIIVGATLGNQVFEQNATISLFHICIECPPVWESPIFWLAILTTIGFQVLSNFANDYGDGVKGTDANRQGEKRMVASGAISPKQMKRGMTVVAVISLFLASLLIFMAFGDHHFLLAFLFFNLAIASVIAAIKYTVGKKAYGYSGFGDLFVYIFFGLVSVVGSYFLYTKSISWDLFLPATSIGLFSVAVLNLNNMRDIENDARVGKNTLVVTLGRKKAKYYHYFLLYTGMLAALVYSILHGFALLECIYAIVFIPFIINTVIVAKNKDPKLLDSQLKVVALGTFAFAILFAWMH